jgi:hypothetical protein
VAGRLKMMGFSTVGSHAALTASHTRRTNSGSVSEKVSGLNSKAHSVPRCVGSSLVSDRTSFVQRTASSTLSSWLKPKTTRRKHSLVAR